MITNSGLMDMIGLGTFIYWVFKGNSSRLGMTFATFYAIRAVFVNVIWLPYPALYYWEDPGVPSLIVSYGPGSDFFYSGHSGFLVICAREWGSIGHKGIRNFIYVVLTYTVFVLLVFRGHYTIDIFAGIFFADYCYLRIDAIKEPLDDFFGKTALKIKRLYHKCFG